MQDEVRKAIREELQRQAAESEALTVSGEGDRLEINGPVDVDVLAFAVVGALAGGP